MIRVIIERKVKKGKELECRELVSELRSKAVHQPGYVTGETWVDDDDPHLWVIISTWIGPELWQSWQSSPERQAITAKLEPLLAVPERTRVLQSWGAVEVDWNVRHTLRAA